MRSETKQIDGTEYQCTTMPAAKALNLMARIAALVGDSLFAYASGAGDENDAAVAGRLLMGKLGHVDVAALCKEMLSSVTAVKESGKIDVGGQAFDAYFSGRIGHLANVIRFVLETNYSDFSIAGILSGSGPAQTDPIP